MDDLFELIENFYIYIHLFLPSVLYFNYLLSPVFLRNSFVMLQSLRKELSSGGGQSTIKPWKLPNFSLPRGKIWQSYFVLEILGGQMPPFPPPPTCAGAVLHKWTCSIEETVVIFYVLIFIILISMSIITLDLNYLP